MKTTYFFLLTVCTTSVYAAPPALTDLSYGSYTPATSTNQIQDSLNKLQSDVSQLKVKVSNLTTRLDNLQGFQSKEYSPLPSGSTVIQPSSGEKARYNNAYAILKAGGYDQAIAEFQSIIKTYPNGEYADNSQYWTGEALLKKGDKQAAMRAFDNVVYAYPRSAKVPDALLKLGITQTSLGNRAKAKEYYDYLIATYPGTASANTAYIKRAGL